MQMDQCGGYAAALELDAEAALDEALAGDAHAFQILTQLATSEAIASVD